MSTVNIALCLLNIKALLLQCNWLSVNQLMYNTLVLQYKILQNEYPKYLYDQFDLDFPRATRLAQSNVIRMGPDYQAEMASNDYKISIWAYI